MPLLLSRDLLCSQNALITFPQTRDCWSLRNSSPRDPKHQSLTNSPAMVSLWIALSGAALLIASHVNTSSSPTVAVCIISCLCSRFQPALSVYPSNSELDKFCHLVRDFDTFFLDWFFFFLSAQLKCFALLVQNISLSLFFFFPFPFLLLKRNPFPLPNILCASKFGRMPAHGETGDKRLSINSRRSDLQHMGRLVIIQFLLCKT